MRASKRLGVLTLALPRAGEDQTHPHYSRSGTRASAISSLLAPGISPPLPFSPSLFRPPLPRPPGSPAPDAAQLHSAAFPAPAQRRQALPPSLSRSGGCVSCAPHFFLHLPPSPIIPLAPPSRSPRRGQCVPSSHPASHPAGRSLSRSASQPASSQLEPAYPGRREPALVLALCASNTVVGEVKRPARHTAHGDWRPAPRPARGRALARTHTSRQRRLTTHESGCPRGSLAA